MLGIFRKLFSSRKVQPLVWEPSQPDIDCITSFIHPHSEQKLCDVLAFCEDGRMNSRNGCRCLLGVFSSAVLHDHCLHPLHVPGHYYTLKETRGASTAEAAYIRLGAEAEELMFRAEGQKLRDHHFLKILRAELARRENERELRTLFGSREVGEAERMEILR